MRGGIVLLGMGMVFFGIVIAFLPAIYPSLAVAVMARMGEIGMHFLSLPIVGLIFVVMGFMAFLAGLVAKEDQR